MPWQTVGYFQTETTHYPDTIQLSETVAGGRYNDKVTVAGDLNPTQEKPQ